MVHDFAQRRTFALCGYTNTSGSPAALAEWWSGVVLEVTDRWFVLTAGHVVQALQEYEVIKLVEGKRGHSRRSTQSTSIPVELVNAVYWSEPYDVGFMEVLPIGDMAKERLRLGTVSTADVGLYPTTSEFWGSESIVVSGYPKLLGQRRREGLVIGQLTFDARLASNQNVQVTGDGTELSQHHFLLRSEKTYLSNRSQLGENLPDRLGGLSGGGYWTDPDVRFSPKLVGMHIRSGRDEEGNHHLIGVAIGLVLKALADANKGLDETFDRDLSSQTR